MLSKSSVHLFERAKARFGLDVEVFDGNLLSLYPVADNTSRRLPEQSAALRQALAQCLSSGEPRQAVIDGRACRLARVRWDSGPQRTAAMVWFTHSERDDARLASFWDDVVAAILRAETETSERLSAESGQSRRLVAMLRFLRGLGEREHEADLARAVVHAAAVWYDVDARIYQRDLKGDYLLFMALPGADLDEHAARVDARWLDGTSEPQRAPPTIEWGHSSGSDVLLVPIAAASHEAEWVLALVGSTPEDAVPQIATFARLVAVQAELLRSRRRERIRRRFYDLLRQPGVGVEMLAQRVVGELATLLTATGGALTLNRRGRIRILALSGSISREGIGVTAGSTDCLFAPDQLVCTMSLAPDVSATLELRSLGDDTFTPDAAMTMRTVADMLHAFLRGAESTLVDAAAPSRPVETAVVPRPVEAANSPFFDRLREELERAKRFDLQLSLVVVEMPVHVAFGEWSQRVQDAVRGELRGSDILGNVNGRRVVALLTHTDDVGARRVVERLRRCLADAPRLGVAGISVGRSAFSAGCRTPEALVATALRDAALLGAY